jgi:hypothetical protein
MIQEYILHSSNRLFEVMSLDFSKHNLILLGVVDYKYIVKVNTVDHCTDICDIYDHFRIPFSQ